MSKWSIFDVPLTPKFTEDSRNVLKVNSKKEIFFDVFECTFNGENIIVEKIGEEDGLPIVKFETIRDSTKLSCEAILVVGNECELFLNENNLQFIKNIKKPIVKNIIQEKVEKVIPVDTVYESKVKNLSEKIIAESEEKANKLYDSKLQEYKSRKQEITQQAEQYLNDKSESIKRELNEQFIDFLSDNDDNVKKIIKRNIDDISSNVDESIKSIILKVEKLSGSNKQELIKILSENINNINNNIDGKIEDLSNELEVILHDNTSKINKLEEKTNSLLKTNVKKIEKNISSRVKELNDRVDDYKVDTLKAIVEKVAENKSDIEKSLKNTISKINKQVNLKNTDVKKILSTELSNINEKLNIFSEEEDKKYKQLLENLNNLNKGEVKEILSEKLNDKQLNSLKLDISKQFQNEMTSIKRLVEMSSGGGSIAKQFANGGTMEGSLNVTQNILSGGVNLDEIFATNGGGSLSEYLPLSGGNLTGPLSSNDIITAVTGDFTNINALTANFTQTIVSTTSALSVVNDGTGPALYVQQSGSEPIAHFIDKDGSDIVISDNGKLGIGTFTPSAKLHVLHGSDEVRFGRNTSQYVRFSGDASSNTIRSVGVKPFRIEVNAGQQLQMGVNSSEHLVIDDGGNIGIGTKTPSEKLTVAGNVSASGSMTGNGISSNGNLDMNGNSIVNVASGSITFEDGASIGSSGTGNLSLSGNVGIGTDTPSEKLEVNGNTKIDGIFTLIDQANDGLKTITAENNNLTFASVHGIFGYSIGLRGNRGSTLGMESAGSILDISAPSDITLTPGGDTEIQSDLTVVGNISANRALFEGSAQSDTVGVVDIHGQNPDADRPLISLNKDDSATGDGWGIGVGDTGQFDGYFYIKRNGQSLNSDFYITNTGIATFGSSIAVNDGDAVRSNTSGSLAFWKPYDGNSESLFSFRGGSTAKMNFQSYYYDGGFQLLPSVVAFTANSDGGKVGINGDESPEAHLEITQSSGVDALMVSSDAGQDGDVFIIDDQGNVGIGTNSPDELLHLEATGQSGTREVLMKASVSDSGNDQFGVSNGTSFNSNFAPTFYGYKDSSYSSGYIYSLNFRGLIPTNQDTTNTNRFGIIHFEAYTTDNANDPNNNLVGSVANRKVLTVANGGTTVIDVEANGNVGIGTETPSAKLDVNGDANIATSLTVGTTLDVGGHFSAATKSFLIDNPNGGKLQYGVIEGREHAVYYRGKTTDSTIQLPKEWEWLVEEDSVTVTVTPVGKFQPLYVISQNNETVEVGGVEGEYNYVVYGTRKDVNKLEVNI